MTVMVCNRCGDAWEDSWAIERCDICYARSYVFGYRHWSDVRCATPAETSAYVMGGPEAVMVMKASSDHS